MIRESENNNDSDRGPLSSSFKKACIDQLYLSERGYSIKQIVKLVGDHYRLSAEQRSVLMRGIVYCDKADQRREKLLPPQKVAGMSLSIDTCNVLAVVGNYLSGRFLYIATDGVVRDAAESSGIFRSDGRRRQAANLLIEGLVDLKPGGLHFYIDAPLTHSRDLARELRKGLSYTDLDAEVELVNSADSVLKGVSDTLVSGDSEIIDAVDRVFDLAHYVLVLRFDADLPDLKSMLESSIDDDS